MMSTENRTQSLPMSNETRGHAIRARRLAHGIKSVRQLADRSGVSREAITAAEAGQASAQTYERLEAWFDAFEEETGSDEANEPHIIVVRLKNDLGEVAVEGPVDDLAELEAAARRLLRGLREDL
jgi:transcriptional regulator with XRE-family HTH domain